VLGLAQVKDVYKELAKLKKRLKREEPEIFERETGILTAGTKKRGRLVKD
jgi:hypothetical protein